jgi:hypothetical protein
MYPDKQKRLIRQASHDSKEFALAGFSLGGLAVQSGLYNGAISAGRPHPDILRKWIPNRNRSSRSQAHYPSPNPQPIHLQREHAFMA